MTLKTVCDGCNNIIEEDETEVTVEVQVAEDEEWGHKKQHLHEQCFQDCDKEDFFNLYDEAQSRLGELFGEA